MRALSGLLEGLQLFVFNDGALCWGFPHFLPLIVLMSRGAEEVWVRAGWAVRYQRKAADDFPNSPRTASDWKQARACCVVWFQ